MRQGALFHPAERIPRGELWIHLMAPGELPQVIALEGRSFAHPWSPELVAQEVEQEYSTILVASSGGVVVGFIILWVILDEIHILNIAVEPSMRRRGIAKKLLEELLARGKASELVLATLEVRAGNEGAIGLYRALGFDEVGRRKGYYSDGEDALVMQRDL